MTKIQPLTLWVDGTQKTAKWLEVVGIGDNFTDAAQILWRLRENVAGVDGETDSAGNALQMGSLTIDGQDYIDWGNVPAMAVNKWIVDWTAGKLNLTIVVAV